MKKIIYFALFLFTSCAQFPHLVKDGKEYARINQLGLTNQQELKLIFKTDYKSPFAIIDPRYEGFIYQIDFDYLKLLNDTVK